MQSELLSFSVGLVVGVVAYAIVRQKGTPVGPNTPVPVVQPAQAPSIEALTQLVMKAVADEFRKLKPVDGKAETVPVVPMVAKLLDEARQSLEHQINALHEHSTATTQLVMDAVKKQSDVMMGMVHGVTQKLDVPTVVTSAPAVDEQAIHRKLDALMGEVSWLKSSSTHDEVASAILHKLGNVAESTADAVARRFTVSESGVTVNPFGDVQHPELASTDAINHVKLGDN